MFSVADALKTCIAFAALQGEYAYHFDNELAEAVERLLFELQLKRDESEHFYAILKEWGIPAKRRTLKRLESGGFEAGWSD